MASPEPSVTLVATAKNEGRFFLEWLAYHRLIGVTNFLIYTNDCEDESPALLDRLAEMGILTHVPNPIAPGELPQRKAQARARQHPLVKQAEYLLPIDLDEFLVVKTGANRIADLIATAPEADAICIQMRLFGDNGHATLPRGLVIENFTRSARDNYVRNGQIKTLIKNSAVFTHILRTHLPAFNPANRPRIFNCGAEELRAPFGEKGRWLGKANWNMKYAQINHYALKTFDYFRAKKYRGAVDILTDKFHMGLWQSNNRNDEKDLTIQRHVPAVKAVIAEWLTDPILDARNRRCFEAFDAILRKTEHIEIEPAPPRNRAKDHAAAQPRST